MNNKDFDTLWEMAGAEGRGSRLAGEYPAWQARRRRNTGIALATVAVLAVTTPMMLPQHTPDTYLKVYCNNHSTTDSQWATLAGEMLLS